MTRDGLETMIVDLMESRKWVSDNVADPLIHDGLIASIDAAIATARVMLDRLAEA